MSKTQGLDPTEKKMLLAGGVALVFSIAAIGMTAIQILANPSGTFVVGTGIIAVTAVIGLLGLAAFGALWASRGTKKA
jgi:hypothetical protein